MTSSESEPEQPNADLDGAAGDTAYLRQIINDRIAAADALRADGIDPYPPRTGRTQTLSEARAAFEAYEGSNAESESEPPPATLAGRIQAIRNMGRIAFIDMEDDGGAIQVLASRRALSDDWALLERLDLGDHIEAVGTLIRSRRGEISLQAEGLRLLSKSLRPPPEKYHGLQNVEQRYRRRYLDLMSNPEAKAVLRDRSRIVAALRRFMDGRGFLEVETPVLQQEAGGAAARPFLTHLNALDEPRQLRIALELHLKRLIVGGFDRVYEIGRVFRNEGIGNRWNPEFTMLESYQAYADYHDVAEMVEHAIAALADEVRGARTLTWRGAEIDLTPPFARVTMLDAVREYVGVDFRDYDTVPAMESLLRERRIAVPPNAGWGKLFDELVSELVEPQLQQPTYLLDYPLAISPLAKRTQDDPNLVERFELFIGGWEIANAYTELNDPVDQRQRFEAQLQLQAEGDQEAEQMDEDFLVALEHGMPPTGGLGMGIDRLAMLLTDQQSIRDVILFPQMRRIDR